MVKIEISVKNRHCIMEIFENYSQQSIARFSGQLLGQKLRKN